MIFHKTIVINVNFEIEDFEKCILELSAIFYLFQDLNFIVATKYEYIHKLKEKLFYFDHVKVILKDPKATTLTTDKKELKCSNNVIFSRIDEGCEITTGAYWYNDQLIDAATYLKLVPKYKTIVYYLGEANIAYLRKNFYSDLLNKLVDDLSELRSIDNVVIVYKPQFTYEKHNLNLTNQRIDDVMQLIRNFCFNYFKTQCPVLYAGNVTNDNVLSFCISNNIDGFAYDWNHNNINELLDFIRKIHGWQRIIVNQARRRVL